MIVAPVEAFAVWYSGKLLLEHMEVFYNKEAVF